jgi:transcriptional regulator with GAF, ATPase, and Fis domain
VGIEAREERIVATFVELSSTLIDDFDIVDFLHRLVEGAVELLDRTDGGVLLADPKGRLHVMTSSSERAEELELLQAREQTGPCFDCYGSSEQVFSEDLTRDLERWPSFGQAALDAGICSAHAIPMRVRGRPVGALNLFHEETEQLDTHQAALGQGMADVAAVALMQERAIRETRAVATQLQRALDSRVSIEQAKGVLAERAHISVEDAFAIIRAYARAHNQRLADVAGEVVERHLETQELLALRPRGDR